jgi:hypothetical protein
MPAPAIARQIHDNLRKIMVFGAAAAHAPSATTAPARCAAIGALSGECQLADSQSLVFVDGHVHVYPCYDAERVFDGAWRHFQAVANSFGTGGNFQGLLVFTESAGDQVFRALAESTTGAVGQWRIIKTGEASSLSLQRGDGARMLVCAGRQLVSAEKLELSAYFVTEPLADGAPLDTLLQQVDQAGGLSVLPWGVGKWLGKRGQEVKKRLAHRKVPLLVSDNGGRPWFWPEPRLFRMAQQQGIPVLAGSDALPMAAEQQQAGSYGFVLQGALSLESPSRDFKNRLLSLQQSPSRYGKLEAAWRFFRNQLGMRLQSAR